MWYRRSYSEVLCKKVILKNFVKFTRKLIAYGIRLSHIFEIPSISNEKLSISIEIPSFFDQKPWISIEILGISIQKF